MKKNKISGYQKFAVMGRIAYQKDFEFSEGYAWTEDGCGSGKTEALGIYKNEIDAQDAKKRAWGYKQIKIVPIEIRILLPKKKTKKNPKGH